MKIDFGKALNFQESMEETAKFSKYLFTSPNPLYTAPVILCVSVLLGFLFFYPDKNAWFWGIAIFGLPAIVSAILIRLLVAAEGGKMYLRRSFLLCLLSLLFPVFFGLLWRIMSLFLGVKMMYALYVSIASIGFFQHFVIYAIAIPSHIRALPVSILHTLISAIAVFLIIPSHTEHIFVFAISMALFLLASIIFMEVVSAPMKRFFGAKAGTLVKPVLDHLTDKSVESATEVEKFFYTISSDMNVYAGVLGIKTRNKSLLVVVPAVHPGPFSMIGGGDLPRKVKNEIKGWKHIMVPHGSATHDFNLSTTEECVKIAKFAEKLAKNIFYGKEGSEFVRVNENNFSVCAQYFGNTVVVVATSAPFPTDDIDYSTGLHAIRIAQRYAENVIFIDAHNCLVKGSGAVRMGMERAENLLANVEKAVKLAGEKKGKIKVGYAEDSGFTIDEGIGPQGIQVLCVECNGKSNAYVLIDGNNMVPGLREKILKSIENIVTDAEVLTTDNHIVNATIGGFNPIGKKIPEEKLIKRVRGVVEKAMSKMEEAEAGGNAGILKNVRVFGHETAPRLATVMNTTYLLIWPILVAMYLLPTFLSLLLMYLLL